jgi:TonB family protein
VTTKIWFPILILFFGLLSAYGQEAKSPAAASVAPWVLHAKLSHEVDPEYPSSAIEKRMEGDVFVDIVVDENGKVQVKEGYCGGCSSILVTAAIAAVEQWVYRPTVVDGRPVTVDSWVAFRFRSEGQPAVEVLTKSKSSTPMKPHIKPPKTLRVSSGVAVKLLLYKVEPIYPRIAEIAHIEGDVLIQCLISKEGMIVKARVLSGDNLLAQAALDAIKQWRYTPYLLNGKPVELETTLTIKFHLSH